MIADSRNAKSSDMQIMTNYFEKNNTPPELPMLQTVESQDGSVKMESSKAESQASEVTVVSNPDTIGEMDEELRDVSKIIDAFKQ